MLYGPLYPRFSETRGIMLNYIDRTDEWKNISISIWKIITIVNSTNSSKQKENLLKANLPNAWMKRGVLDYLAKLKNYKAPGVEESPAELLM